MATCFPGFKTVSLLGGLLSFLFLFVAEGTFCQKKKEKEAQPAINVAEAQKDYYPANIKKLRFTSQGQDVEMAYIHEKSARPRQRTVLLLHGKNFNMEYWDSTMSELIYLGFDVVAVDQVGFGKSSMPHDYQYSFQQLATNTKLLLDSLSLEKVIVVGHSMGGMLAMRFAIMYPEMIDQLILENPIGLEDWKTVVPYSSIDEEYKKELNRTPEELKSYMISNYFSGTWKPQYDSLLHLIRNFYNGDKWTEYARTMALTTDMIFTQPVCYELNQIKVPTLLIIGLNDKTAIGKDRAPKELSASLGNYSQLGKKTASEINDAQLIELQGVGHIPHVENFRQFFEPLIRQLNLTQPDPRKKEE